MGAPIRRARRGSIANKLLVPMDAELERQLRRAARLAGISVSEYVRRAIHARLADQASHQSDS